MKLNLRYKEKLKYGFALFLGASFIFMIDFMINILNSPIRENMDLASWIYYIFAALTQASTFSLILFVCFYLPFAFFFKNKKIATTIFCTVAILVQVVLMLDIFVFDLYKFHINGFVLELVFGGSATDIFVFDWSLYLQFVAFVLFLAVLPFILIAFVTSKTAQKIKPKLIKGYIALLFVSLLVSHIGYAIAHATNKMSIQKSATALPLYFPLTANSLLTKLGIVNPSELDNLAYNENSSDIQYPVKPIEVSDSINKYNIVYIVIDSWNPSTFDTIVSPNIHAFAQKGQTFSKHFSSSNGTRGSLFGIFFGLSYSYGQEFYMSKMSPLFVDRLIDLKYDIEVYPSANFTNPPFNEIIFRRVPGINIKTEGNNAFEKDKKITEQFVDFLDKRDSQKAFFSLLFYDLPHAISIPKEHQAQFQPSWETPEYLKLNNEMDRTPFFNLYKNCVYAVDQMLGEVFSTMESKGLLENTIVVITGDHGQEFNENKKNYWGHSGNYSKWQIQVPLIVYYPGIEQHKNNTYMTSHYDIAPTVLNRFLGVKNESSDYSMGYDLWNPQSRYPHIVGDYINYGFVTEDMILTTGHTGSIEVTDNNLKDLPKSAINTKTLQEVIKKKNMFYKK